MTIQWLYLVNVILISRLPVLFRDRKVPWRLVIATVLFQEAALLVFKWTVSTCLLALGLALLAVIWWRFEESDSRLVAKRLLVLAGYLTITAWLCARRFAPGFSPQLSQLLEVAGDYFVLAELNVSDPMKLNLYLLGTLLCLNEGNLLVRYIIQTLDLRPKEVGHHKADPIEYNRGRVIGLLERLTLFTLVAGGQFAAIGFIIAAKAMARFKRMEEQDFGEYFLVGTLASLVVAGGFALLIQHLVAAQTSR